MGDRAGPLTARHRFLISVLDWVQIETLFVDCPVNVGRPVADQVVFQTVRVNEYAASKSRKLGPHGKGELVALPVSLRSGRDGTAAIRYSFGRAVMKTESRLGKTVNSVHSLPYSSWRLFSRESYHGSTELVRNKCHYASMILIEFDYEQISEWK